MRVSRIYMAKAVAKVERRKRTLALREKFLDDLRIHGVKRAACAAAGINHETIRQMEGDDEEFAERVQSAIEHAVGSLERIGMACAVKALKDPKYTACLIFALKAKANWKDHQSIDVNVNTVAIIEYEDIDGGDEG